MATVVRSRRRRAQSANGERGLANKPNARTPVPLEAELRQLDDAVAHPQSAEARAALGAALARGRSLVVAHAARTITKHGLDDFGETLALAFARFLEDPIKRDPGCHAKIATIESLDHAESTDVATFVRAARVVQLEAAWGPPVDTAAPVRARAIVALARLGRADFALHAATLLTDPIASVRQCAADALAHRGDPANAPVALLKVRTGDEDPLAMLAAMSALMVLAPTWALDELRPLLDETGARRELAAIALGQSRVPAALDMLLDALERCVRSADRAVFLRGIGLNRSDRALNALLAVVADRGEADARVAMEALVPRRFEPGLTARVREAAARNPHGELSRAIDELFAADERSMAAR